MPRCARSRLFSCPAPAVCLTTGPSKRLLRRHVGSLPIRSGACRTDSAHARRTAGSSALRTAHGRVCGLGRAGAYPCGGTVAAARIARQMCARDLSAIGRVQRAVRRALFPVVHDCALQVAAIRRLAGGCNFTRRAAIARHSYLTVGTCVARDGHLRFPVRPLAGDQALGPVSESLAGRGAVCLLAG
jgi:hypothetical protein